MYINYDRGRGMHTHHSLSLLQIDTNHCEPCSEGLNDKLSSHNIRKDKSL